MVIINKPPLKIKANSCKSRITIIFLVIVALAIILGGVLSEVLGRHANARLSLEIANGTSIFTSMGPKITSTSFPLKSPTIHNKAKQAATTLLNKNVEHYRIYYQ